MTCQICGKQDTEESHNCFQYLKERNRELDRMLDLAWGAICEAGYEGYDNELREFMEN